MQQDRQDPSNTFISQWEGQRDAPPSSQDIQAGLHAPHPWKWGWSPFIGIMYGPIPVGIIICLPLLIALWR